MDIVLPKEIGYSPSLPSLPECISQEIVLSPVNGQKFTAGQLIQFDLTNRGFLDPQSVYLRYKYTLANGTGEVSVIRGTPVYAFISKLETIFGSQIVESINYYNQVCNMMTNLQMDVAMKYGQQSAYGWSVTNTDISAATYRVPTIEELDGRQCNTNETGSFAAPLPCMLSMAEKLIPMQFMPSVRIQLTTEAISNVFGVTAAIGGSPAFAANVLPTGYTLENVELCYTMIDFAGDVNDIVRNMAEQFYIKSTSFSVIGATLAQGIQGSLELMYNLRLASIKSLFANFAGNNAANTLNGIFDSVDVTNNTGEYSFNIAGTPYPSRPINVAYNRSGALMELKKAVGALHSTDYNFSINSKEWNRTGADNTTITVPGKFWIGVNTERLSSSGVLLSGVSTQSSPISLRITTNSNTSQQFLVNLIAMYDCLIQVTPEEKSAIVKQ